MGPSALTGCGGHLSAGGLRTGGLLREGWQGLPYAFPRVWRKVLGGQDGALKSRGRGEERENRAASGAPAGWGRRTRFSLSESSPASSCDRTEPAFNGKVVANLASPGPYWASLVAQTVKSLSAMQETQVRSLGQEGPLKKSMATHFRILA